MITKHPLLFLLLVAPLHTIKGMQVSQTSSTIDNSRCAQLLAIDAAMDTTSTELPTLTISDTFNVPVIPEIDAPAEAVPAFTTTPTLFATVTMTATMASRESRSTSQTTAKPLLHARAKQRTSPLTKPTCPVCKQTFSQKHSLDDHMRTHTGVKPFACDFDGCTKRFAQRAGLRNHKFTHLSVEKKPLACPLCPLHFAQQAHLRSHMRTHTGEKTFKCEECGELFALDNTLKCHIRTHTGEKPFICKQCGKGFAQKGTLNKHLRTHTGENLYHCSICGQGFTQKHSATIHEKSQHKDNQTTATAANSTPTAEQPS